MKHKKKFSIDDYARRFGAIPEVTFIPYRKHIMVERFDLSTSLDDVDNLLAKLNSWKERFPNSKIEYSADAELSCGDYDGIDSIYIEIYRSMSEDELTYYKDAHNKSLSISQAYHNRAKIWMDEQNEKVKLYNNLTKQIKELQEKAILEPEASGHYEFLRELSKQRNEIVFDE